MHPGWWVVKMHTFILIWVLYLLHLYSWCYLFPCSCLYLYCHKISHEKNKNKEASIIFAIICLLSTPISCCLILLFWQLFFFFFLHFFISSFCSLDQIFNCSHIKYWISKKKHSSKLQHETWKLFFNMDHYHNVAIALHRSLHLKWERRKEKHCQISKANDYQILPNLWY